MRFLIVDDSPVIRTMLRQVLSQFGAVVEAENGQLAVSVFREHAGRDVCFDMIFMDINMPVMDGITAARGIRKIEMLKRRMNITDIPFSHIIIQTTEGGLDKVVDAHKQARCNGYIVKPYTQEAIADRVLQFKEKRGA